MLTSNVVSAHLKVLKVAHNWLFAGTVYISMQIIRYGARYVFFIRQYKLNLMPPEGRS